MAVTKINSSSFPMEFTGDETLIVKVGDDPKTTAINGLKQLNAAGKTVVVTDAYLFESHQDPDYADLVRDILLSLKAKKIIHAPDNGPGEKKVRDYVKTALQAQGCQFEYKKSKIHDRYWLCLDNGNAIVMSSINNLGKKTSTLKPLATEEVTDLREQLTAQSVLDDDVQ